jgi:hypothetical protein
MEALSDVLAVTILLNEMDRWTDIAKELEAQGIKGYRGDACQCPVARFVKQTLPVHFTVSQSYFVVNHIDQNYVTPRRVAEFIADFDMGYHPRLEDKVWAPRYNGDLYPYDEGPFADPSN